MCAIDMRRSNVPLRPFAGTPSGAIPSLLFPAYLPPPTSNRCLFIHFRTLLRHGALPSALPSITSALFSSPRRGWGSHSSPNLQTFKRATFKRSYEPLATVDSKQLTQALSPLESALTDRPQLIENTATLSSLDATLTRFGAATPLEATLTKKGGVGGSNRKPL